MPCIKTGCQIFIEPYGEYAYGDAFEVQVGVRSVYYFRLVARSFKKINKDFVDFTVYNYDNWFDQNAPTGQTSTMISANVITQLK